MHDLRSVSLFFLPSLILRVAKLRSLEIRRQITAKRIHARDDANIGPSPKRTRIHSVLLQVRHPVQVTTGLCDPSAFAIDDTMSLILCTWRVSYTYIFITTSRRSSNRPFEDHDSNVALCSNRSFFATARPKVTKTLRVFLLSVT